MEQKNKSLIGWFRSLRLSHKLMASVGLLIFCSNFLILLLVCESTINSLRQKTCEQLQSQLTISLSTASSSVSDVTTLMTNLSAATEVEEFVDDGPDYQEHYLETVNQDYEAMRLLLSANTVVNYVALLRTDGSECLFVGEALTSAKAQDILLENYQTSRSCVEGGIQAAILKNVYESPEINLFYPLYQRYHAPDDAPAALLVVGIDLCRMQEYIKTDNEDLNLRLLAKDGTILVSTKSSEIGTQAEWSARYTQSRGELSIDGNLIAYQCAEDDSWMADGSISQEALFAGIRRSARWTAVIILALTALAIVICAFCCRWFYTPIQELVQAMSLVSEGDLDTTIRDYEGKDFQQLSDGFNQMLTAVKGLIASIQRRERENTEIRLNALQSQIKPHFLYNTLECIHWQALLAGDTEVSEMVMALSRYYRLCLSKGQDIVPLSQEIEHTQSYVTIQNVRFDNILKVDYRIPEELLNVLLPKITLQPLVENAIYHGFKSEENRKGRVVISGEVAHDAVLLRVADDGVGMSDAELDHLNATMDVLVNDGSYGVKNVHQRIAIRYGKGYGLRYEKNASGGVTVIIRLPGINELPRGE